MKILIFSDLLTEAIISNIGANGWLNSAWQWEFLDSSKIEDFHNGTLGLDHRKLASLTTLYDKCVVITDHNFVAEKYVFDEDNVLFISYAHVGDLQTLLRFLYTWFCNEIMHCLNTKCVFGDKYIDANHCICDNCQEALTNAGFFDALIRLLVLTKTTEDPENTSLGTAVRKHLIEGKNPIVNNLIADIEINDLLSPESSLRRWVTGTATAVVERKKDLKEGYASRRERFLSYPRFIAARKWNSWTPNLPRNTSAIALKKGGGYFVSDGQFNLCIDPGYGFMQMLYSYHGITVMDLDGILITHDHQDHSSELQNILSLRHVYNITKNKLKIYLNGSTYYLFERWITYYNPLFDKGYPQILLDGTEVNLGGMTVKCKGMFHDEIIDKIHDTNEETKKIISAAIGLDINIRTTSGCEIRIAIPGDTSFPETDGDISAVANFYGKPDIASIHVGSLEPAWVEKPKVEASKIVYGKNAHLGLVGAIRMLKLLQPRIGILTEFGEELDEGDNRLTLAEIIKEALYKQKNTTIIPGDANLEIVNKDNQFFCWCNCGKYVPYEKVSCGISNNDINYVYSAGCKSGLSHFNIT